MSDQKKQPAQSSADRTLRLDVWQFVRLMVQLEETLEAAGGGKGSNLKKLYDEWENLWVDLDAKLVDLGKNDMDAFADMMMNQEVVLDDVSPGAREIVAGELDKVISVLKKRLNLTEDPSEVEDLSFERDELARTARQLRAK